jgi:hypothetical protein
MLSMPFDEVVCLCIFEVRQNQKVYFWKNTSHHINIEISYVTEMNKLNVEE